MAHKIDYSKCVNCKLCYERCPECVYELDEEGKVYVKRPEACWLCGACRFDCPKNCIEIIYDASAKPVLLSSRETQ